MEDAKAAHFAQTVLDSVQPGMTAFDQETFGPVAAITVTKDVEEAIDLANQNTFGLSVAVRTKNLAVARDVSRRLETGGVFINGSSASDPRTPIGGVKLSGYGRELSHFLLSANLRMRKLSE